MKIDKRIILTAVSLLVIISVVSLLSGCGILSGDNGNNTSNAVSNTVENPDDPTSDAEKTTSPDSGAEPSSDPTPGSVTENTPEGSGTPAATQTESSPVSSDEATSVTPPDSSEGPADTAPDTSADDTSSVPPEITTEPDITTAPPVVTTEPVVTTAPPAVTTEPDITTAPPAVTTEPVVTTAPPVVTTEPVVTTAPPVVTTEPVVTTAPEPTSAPHVHTPEPIPAVAATCTATGLTAGSKCSVCGQILTSQQTVPVTAHVPYVSIEATAATERKCGYSAQTSCKTCGKVITARTFQPATGYKNPDLYSSDWGYKYLAGLSNGANRQAFYRLLETTALEFHRSSRDADYELANDYPELVDMLKLSGIKIVKDLDISSFGLTNNELCETWSIFRTDHPLFYWLSPTYYKYMIGNRIYFQMCCEEDYAQGSVRDGLNAKIYDSVKSVHIAASEKVSVYGQALAVHNSICDRIEYKFMIDTVPDTSFVSHCILGWFTDYGGVCECYAKTFQLFMNFFGFECITVSNEVHMWNLMKFDDGSWYWVDATFDDPYNLPGTTMAVYFCRNDTENVYLNSGFIGNSNFFGSDHNHDLLPAGGFDAPLPQHVRELYGNVVNTYGDCGINIVPEIPARGAAPYAGPKN